MIAKAMFLWKSAFGSQRKERRGEAKIKKWCPVLQAAKPFVFGAER